MKILNIFHFFSRDRQETLLSQMQVESKKLKETLEDIDLNEQVIVFESINKLL